MPTLVSQPPPPLPLPTHTRSTLHAYCFVTAHSTNHVHTSPIAPHSEQQPCRPPIPLSKPILRRLERILSPLLSNPNLTPSFSGVPPTSLSNRTKQSCPKLPKLPVARKTRKAAPLPIRSAGLPKRTKTPTSPSGKSSSDRDDRHSCLSHLLLVIHAAFCCTRLVLCFPPSVLSPRTCSLYRTFANASSLKTPTSHSARSVSFSEPSGRR